MRLSTGSSDWGENSAWRKRHDAGKTITVYLDGEKIEDCVAADEEAGVVQKGKRDAAGDFEIVDDEIAVETLHGQVRIEIID